MSEHLLPSKKRTSPPPSTTVLTSSKKPKPPPLSPETTFFTTDDDDDAILNEEDDDDSAALISNLLDFSSPPKANPFPLFKARFVSYPYLPSSPFECCTSYITINGNEETCGSSFSDTDSSVMASVDTCGAHISDISNSFRFLRVGNNDDDVVFCSDEVKSREEHEDGVWDWGEFLGEDGEGKEDQN